MKNLKKKLAKKAGFTLVELIVVIAILAILASVAVPAYTGYIQKAQESKVYSSLDALKTAVVFTATENAEGHIANVTTITVKYTAAEGSTAAKLNVTASGKDASGAAANYQVEGNTAAGTSNYTDLFTNGSDLMNAMKDANVSEATWSSEAASWTLK